MILLSGQAVPPIPGLYVGIVPPQTNYLSPAATDILGVVGTATWGPVNSPTVIGGLPDYVAQFGNPQNRAYDMGTHVWAAYLQGAQNFRCVRVTDGTDVAASGALGIQTATSAIVAGGATQVVNDVLTLSNGATVKVTTIAGGAITAFTVLTQPTSQVAGAGAVTQVSTTGTGTGATFTFTYTYGVMLTSKYTGSGGSTIQGILSAGAQANTWRLTVFMPGVGTQVFDNIGAGLTGAALWAAIASAVNNGNAVMSPSSIAIATAGASTAAPTAQTVTLSGGSDGVTTITTSVMVGVQSSPPTGMYALAKKGVSVADLADLTDSTSWPAQIAFGLANGIYMVTAGPAGQSISAAVTAKSGVGADSAALRVMFGDWCYFLDTINGLTRLVSPQGFIAGRLAAWGPQFSALNQMLYGIVGTQKSNQNQVYQTADLAQLQLAGIDVITNPVPGGAYFGSRIGCNASSNPATNGDNYTRMTNFIAATIDHGMGGVIGDLQSPTEQAETKATLDAFFDDMWQNGVIGASDPSITPWLVVLDSSNNPQSQVASGLMVATISVIYLSVITRFLVNLQGGQTVTITNVTSQPYTPPSS